MLVASLGVSAYNDVAEILERIKCLTALTDKNRPISQLHGVEKLYSQRKDKYESWCDYRFYYDRFEEKQDFYDKAIADILGALK